MRAHGAVGCIRQLGLVAVGSQRAGEVEWTLRTCRAIIPCGAIQREGRRVRAVAAGRANFTSTHTCGVLVQASWARVRQHASGGASVTPWADKRGLHVTTGTVETLRAQLLRVGDRRVGAEEAAKTRFAGGCIHSAKFRIERTSEAGLRVCRASLAVVTPWADVALGWRQRQRHIHRGAGAIDHRRLDHDAIASAIVKARDKVPSSGDPKPMSIRPARRPRRIGAGICALIVAGQSRSSAAYKQVRVPAAQRQRALVSIVEALRWRLAVRPTQAVEALSALALGCGKTLTAAELAAQARLARTDISLASLVTKRTIGA